MRIRGGVSLVASACALLSLAQDAHAYTTRLHISIANEVRTALVASGGTGVALKLGAYTIVLSPADAKAITEQPLAFRAGAVGPDNVIFPGMTDPSHAIEQHPYEQCQILYDMAVNDEERAYAIGCFLHGSTDAIAHHYVNWLTGETFTLNPITSTRGSSWSNVVRHITAESMVQKAAFTAKPGNFGAGAMAHAIPKGFVLRAYFDTKSPLWAVAAKHAKEKFEATRAAKPGASLPTLVSSSGLAPAEQLVLAPMYLEEIEAGRVKLRADVEATIKNLQNPATTDGAKLKVTAGADGKLGTLDDKTACTVSCATLYAKYFTYVSMLQPRKDAGGMALPSAFDKISDELGVKLRKFSPSMVSTIENVSNKLNGPLSAGSDGLDMSKADVAVAFAPMQDWANELTTLDYQTITKAVVPDWLQKVEDLMNSVGVSVTIPDIVAALMQPVVQPIKDAVKTYVIDQAQAQVGTLVDEYKKNFATTSAEFDKRLTAAAGSKGSILANFYDSGLWAHSFNVAAAAIARHELVLPEKGTDVGPATFDASHTPAWMQLGVCDYLRQAVFPLGLDIKALLSTTVGGAVQDAKIAVDSPVECHDGSLSSFTKSPTTANCKVVGLAALMSDPRGSVSRAYPPSFGETKPTCRNLKVEGLPDPPPPADDAGVPPLDDAGNPIVDDAGTDPGATPGATEEAAGCGCSTPGGSRSEGLLAGLVLAGMIASRRRRRAGLVAAVLSLTGCGSTETTTDGVVTDTATEAELEDTAVVEEVAVDSGPPVEDTRPDVVLPDAGSPAGKLLEALGDSTWNATQPRLGKTRAYELSFRASTLEWGEIQNPYGPARARTLRVFSVDADGKTVHSTILSPSGWPIHPDNGKKETFTFELLAGSPRKLRITNGSTIETFTEGAWAKPTTGLTAFVNVFSTTGKVNEAFCGSGSFSSINHAALWEFARGKSTEKPTGTDVMAGAKLTEWIDTSAGDNFAVTDVPGFRSLGGTLLSDQANFIVRYVGRIKHPGGVFKLRERDDDVMDAVWAFIGSKANTSLSVADLFLEVHGKASADSTVDEPSTTLSTGEVPIEIFVLRCAAKIQQTDVEISLGGGAWQLVGNAPSIPQIDATLFPPVL